MKQDRNNQGATILEVIVSLFCVAIMACLLLSQLTVGRRTSLAAASGHNMNQMARGMAINHSQNANGALNSGAFDWYRDGDVREVGWVADMVDSGVINPGMALDPGSPHRLCETTIRYTGAMGPGDLKDPKNKKDYYWGEDGVKKAKSEIPNKIPEIQNIFDEGYNTNYACSWQLVRSDPKSKDRSSGDRHVEDGSGVMTLDIASMAQGGAAAIPLMAEARAATDGWLAKDLDDGPNSALWKLSHASTRQGAINQVCGDDAKSGGWCTESFCGGMVAQDKRRLVNDKGAKHAFNAFWPHHLSKPSDVSVPGKNGEPQILNSQPVEGFCNVLFADFHVGRVTDQEGWDGLGGDGYIGAYPVLDNEGRPVGYELSDEISGELENHPISIGKVLN